MMQRQHFALAPRTEGAGWVSLAKEHGAAWRATGIETRSLESVLTGTFQRLRANSAAEFTFSAGRHGQLLVSEIAEGAALGGGDAPDSQPRIHHGADARRLAA